MKKYIVLIFFSFFLLFFNVIYPKCMGEHIFVKSFYQRYYSPKYKKERSQNFNKRKYNQEWKKIDQGFNIDIIMDSLSVKGTVLKYKENYTVEDAVMNIPYKNATFLIKLGEKDTVFLSTKTEFYTDVFKSTEGVKEEIEKELGISLEEGKNYVESQKEHYITNLDQISENEYLKTRKKMVQTVIFILGVWIVVIMVIYIKKRYFKSAIDKRNTDLQKQ